MNEKKGEQSTPPAVQPLTTPRQRSPAALERLRKISDAGRRAMERAQRELEHAKRNDEHDREESH